MKILDNGTIIEVKSLPEHWVSEQMKAFTYGAKRNTERFVDQDEHDRLTALKRTGTLTHIRVRNTLTNKTFFRTLTDYRAIVDTPVLMVWVFSW